MSKTKRMNRCMLRVGQQYQTLSVMLRGETDAMAEGDLASAMEIRKRVIDQFVELGKQLKELAKDT